MDGAYQFEQDNLILQLKNMEKPPIPKELAKELGFDSKKYESVINKLLFEISEVRKERIKENLIFEKKMKSMQNNTIANDKNILRNNNVKNAKKNTKNVKLDLNRPKSNYKSIKSSGYGIAPKKVNIFSSRPRKKTKDNSKTTNNNIPSHKILNKKNKNIIPNNNKSNNSINIKNNNYYSNNNENKININDVKNNNHNLIDYKELKNEIEKIKNENEIIEHRYENILNNSLDPLNNIMNKKKQNKSIKNEEKDKIIYEPIKYKNNYDLINKNLENISKKIIDELLYELIFDLKNIEDKKFKNQKNEINLENKQSNLNSKVKNIGNIVKYKSKINKDFIEKCNKNKNIFLRYMKSKGSFLINNIFNIYDDFVEETCKIILEQGLDYGIKQMDDFIKLIEKNNN